MLVCGKLFERTEARVSAACSPGGQGAVGEWHEEFGLRLMNNFGLVSSFFFFHKQREFYDFYMEGVSDTQTLGWVRPPVHGPLPLVQIKGWRRGLE